MSTEKPSPTEADEYAESFAACMGGEWIRVRSGLPKAGDIVTEVLRRVEEGVGG